MYHTISTREWQRLFADEGGDRDAGGQDLRAAGGGGPYGGNKRDQRPTNGASDGPRGNERQPEQVPLGGRPYGGAQEAAARS